MVLDVVFLLISALAVPTSVAPLFVPDVATRDVPVIVEQLELDPAQAAVLRDLVKDYATRLEAASQSGREHLESAGVTAWAPRVPEGDLDRLSRGWTTRRQALSQEDDATARARLEQEHRVWARDVVGRLVSQAESAPRTPSPRAQALEAWLTRRDALRAGLDQDIVLLLGPQHEAPWQALRGDLIRSRAVFPETVPGEMLDLQELVSQTFAEDEQTRVELAPLVEAYASQWASVAAARNAALSRLAVRRMDADAAGDVIEMLLAKRSAYEASERLAAVNEHWYRVIGDALDDANRIKLQVAVNQQMHPGIFLPSTPDRMAAWMLEQPELSDQVRRQIQQARALLGARRLRLSAQERQAEALAGARRALLPHEQEVMADVLGPTARFGFEDALADDMLARVTELSAKRRAVDAAFERQLGILAPSLIERVPQWVVQPPQALAPATASKEASE